MTRRPGDITGNGRPSIPAADPVVRFLGPAATRNGPFGVLGLPVDSIDEAGVLAAVHDAMARIDAHPESSTPAADEARLAVHAAAANLLDGAVQRELLARLGGSASVRSAGPRPAHPSPRVHAGSVLEADLLRCIAISGGWNEQAMQHFMKLAHLKGHPTPQAMAAIRSLWRGAGALPISAAAPPPPVASPPRAPEQTASAPASPQPAPAVTVPEDELPGLPPVVAVLLTIVVFAILAAGAWFVIDGLRVPVPPPAEQHAAAPAPGNHVGHPSPPPGDQAPVANTTERALDNAPAIIHELEVAVDGLSVDPDAALTTFEPAVAALANRWGECSPIDRLAAHDQIVGFIYRVSGRRSLADRAMNAIEAGADGVIKGTLDDPGDIWRGAWSMGMLARLRREQNLPGTIIRRIDGVLLRAPGGLSPNASTFSAGAVAALRSIARSLAEPPVSSTDGVLWETWPNAVRAAAAGDDAMADSLMLDALETVLHRRGPGGVVLDEAAGGLVASLNWRAGGAARVWLLRAFDDRTLTANDLHAVTLALATRSKAEGVDLSLVLQSGASEFARRRLRDKYRAIWGVAPGGGQDAAVAAFAAAAREALLHEPNENGRDEDAVLASVCRLARLNTAGELAWRADVQAASDLLGSLDDPIDAVLEAEATPDVSSLFETKSGTWAETYLGAGSHIPRRLELLDKLATRSDQLGPMEAEVLVTEAMRGSPQRVRDAAASIVESFAAQPTVVNAVLEALPVSPRTERNATLIELVAGASLPRFDADDWPLEARRAVVERLLELVAGHAVWARLDALSGLLEEAYDIQLHGLPGGSSAGSFGVGSLPPASVSARQLAQEWAALAARRPPAGLEGYTADEIESRRAARLAMADGLVQSFHAEQLALAEDMALVIAAEQPGSAQQVAQMLADLQIHRDRARDVLIQIEYTERLMLSLRLLRFGEDQG
ncbi:MAG: hypothetical protein H6810_10030 [Phycisphaeraceae bacterium]|nr:MAG: hypothetical protein H6810_10030 [Phycisphaeraceae bacterium]